MASVYYESAKSIAWVKTDTDNEFVEYEVYTGGILDPRVADIILFAEGEKSLQEVYTNLLLHDKENISCVSNPEAFDFGEDPKPIVKPEFVDTPEDIELKGEEILCWDGCQWHIDYVDSDVESGCFFMANGTEVEAWLPMPGKPVKK